MSKDHDKRVAKLVSNCEGPSTDDRRKALERAAQKISKQFGKGSLFRLGSKEAVDVPATPTGSIGLDAALGVGGYPDGRVVEIFGPESSGKTTMMLTAIANAQAAGEECMFIDAEHALDPTWAQTLGVDVDNLRINQPNNGEEALEVADQAVRTHAVGLVVVDSVAALTPKAEIEGDMRDTHVGLQARLMSQGLRKFSGHLQRSGATVVFINQLRKKIGVTFASPETTMGGNALKFYASVRLDIRRIGSIKQGETVVGHPTRVKVVKNKLAPPFREAEFEIRYGEGISRDTELLDLGVKHGLVDKSGSWFSYQGHRLGQGRENVRQFLRDHPEQFEQLEAEVREQLFAPIRATGSDT